MIFSARNPFIGAADWMPTPGGVGPLHYPMDLNGAERHARPKTGWDIFPRPDSRQRTQAQPGMLAPSTLLMPFTNGILPLFDLATYAMMIAKKSFGPGINAPFAGVQSMTRFETVTYPGLTKDQETSPGKIKF